MVLTRVLLGRFASPINRMTLTAGLFMFSNLEGGKALATFRAAGGEPPIPVADIATFGRGIIRSAHLEKMHTSKGRVLSTYFEMHDNHHTS
jgi:hypothetical protein